MDGENAPVTQGMNIPLVKYSDMPEEMRTDSVETVSTAIETSLEKHPQNYEVCLYVSHPRECCSPNCFAHRDDYE